MIVIALAAVAAVAVAVIVFRFRRSTNRHVTFEKWPQAGARFRTQMPMDVTVRREWPMDSCEATLAVGVQLEAHARPEGATNVVCKPILDGSREAQIFVGRPNPRDAYFLSVSAERLKTCCTLI
jgi:hypothetical protein